jgi:ATP-binding cassette subfamily F protein 3
VLPLRHGERLTAQALKIGYFAQHQVEQLREDESPLWHVARDRSRRTRAGPAQFPRRLRFSRRHGERPPSRDSPVARRRGSRWRCSCASGRISLILDEPTNHLDIEMREALAEALQDYTGALIVVAHDRHLLRATTDALWLVADGTVAPFDGDLDDYRDWVLGLRRRAGDAATAPDEKPRTPKRSPHAKTRRSGIAPTRVRTAQAAHGEDCEDRRAQLAALNTERTALETWLSSADAYTEPSRKSSRRRSRGKATLPGSSRGSKPNGSSSTKRWRKSSPSAPPTRARESARAATT